MMDFCRMFETTDPLAEPLIASECRCPPGSLFSSADPRLSLRSGSQPISIVDGLRYAPCVYLNHPAAFRAGNSDERHGLDCKLDHLVRTNEKSHPGI